tara:strand:- start:133 stop:834 length:702 start_codon:yes stop_codon:yes gene_type:complete
LISPFVAILPSAGSASRFKSEVPKQYCTIGGKKVIKFSIDLFIELEECQAICIPISENDQYHKQIEDHSKLHFVEGGSTRAESVKRGYDFLDSDNFNYDNILIHDSARPCLTKTELRRMLEDFSVNKFQALILALPVSDTLKQCDENLIKSTICRENIWRALTPQLFTKKSLKIAYNSNKKDLSNITDEASLFDNLDEEVMIMKGSSENIKITFQEDLRLAETILLNQKRIHI